MTNQEISLVLEQAAALMEIAGANPHKVRAYRRAADTINSLAETVSDLAAAGRLTKLPGVGAGLEAQIRGLLSTGRLEALDSVTAEVPLTVLELLALPGLGPKKAALLWRDLGIATIGEFQYALKENRLSDLKGFGPQTLKRLEDAAAFVLAGQGKMLLPEALELADALKQAAEGLDGVERVEVAGALRRRCELIDEIVLVVLGTENPKIGTENPKVSTVNPKVGTANPKVGTANPKVGTIDPKGLMEQLKASQPFERRLVGPVWGQVHTRPSAVRIHVASRENFGLELLRATGSQQHLADLAAHRQMPATNMNTEKAFYEAMGLQFIPPELREGRGEVKAAASGELPDLVRPEDLKGVLHVHSDWSDGSMSLNELARMGAAHGFEYVGVADHGPAAAYAGGLDERRLTRQIREINKTNQKGQGATLLCGVEADIMADGTLDLPETVLRKLEFVVASVHSRFRMSEEEMTARLCSAVQNPMTTILGHPTGRLLLGRPAYQVNMESVLHECARLGKAVELNAHPQRLDLSWEWGPSVRKLDLKVAVDPDTHHPPGFEHAQRYGVWMARKAWLTRKHVINCMDLEQLRHEGWIKTG